MMIFDRAKYENFYLPIKDFLLKTKDQKYTSDLIDAILADLQFKEKERDLSGSEYWKYYKEHKFKIDSIFIYKSTLIQSLIDMNKRILSTGVISNNDLNYLLDILVYYKASYYFKDTWFAFSELDFTNIFINHLINTSPKFKRLIENLDTMPSFEWQVNDTSKHLLLAEYSWELFQEFKEFDDEKTILQQEYYKNTLELNHNGKLLVLINYQYT